MLVEVLIAHQVEALLPGKRAHVAALKLEPIVVDIPPGDDLKPAIKVSEPNKSDIAVFHICSTNGRLYRPLLLSPSGPGNKPVKAKQTSGFAPLKEAEIPNLAFGLWNWRRFSAKDVANAMEFAPQNPFFHPKIYACPAPSALVHRDDPVRGAFRAGGVERDEAAAYARAMAADLRLLDGILMVPTMGPRVHVGYTRYWRQNTVTVVQEDVLLGAADRLIQPFEEHEDSVEGFMFSLAEIKTARQLAQAFRQQGGREATGTPAVSGAIKHLCEFTAPTYRPNLRRSILQSASNFYGWAGIWAMPQGLAKDLIDLFRMAEDWTVSDADLLAWATSLIDRGALPMNSTPPFREGWGRKMNGAAWEASGRQGALNIHLTVARLTGRMPQALAELRGDPPATEAAA